MNFKTPTELNEHFLDLKKNGKKIAMMTVYDTPFAQMAEAAQVEMLLVGDSMSNVVLGYKSTRDIGMAEMEMAVAAVRRGAPQSVVIGDMPYLSDKTPESTLINAQKLIDAGANAVKIEGFKAQDFAILNQNQIAIVGHLGLLPQTALNYKQAAKTQEEQALLIEQAIALEAFKPMCVVLEHIPHDLAQKVSSLVSYPIIGIGAGPHCDGQVMVLHDILGLGGDYVPPIAKRFINGREILQKGMSEYVNWVKTQGELK